MGYVFGEMNCTFFHFLIFLPLLSCINTKKKQVLSTVLIDWYTIPHSGKEGLDEVNQLLQVYLANPDISRPNQKVLGELSQIYLLRGILKGDKGEADLFQARQHGLACLQLDKGFASILSTTGGNITSESLRDLEASPTIHSCVVWTTTAWAKLLLLRGSRLASVEAESVLVMADWLWKDELSNETGWAGYAIAIAHALHPPWRNPDWKKIQSGFTTALNSAYSNPHWELDYVEYLLIPTDKTEEASFRLQQLSKPDVTLSENLQRRRGYLASTLD